MKFTVSFISNNKSKRHHDGDCRNRLIDPDKIGGFNIVDDIRRSFPQYSDVPLESIHVGRIDRMVDTHRILPIYVSEAFAKNTGLFTTRNDVDVNVPEFGLTPFIKLNETSSSYKPDFITKVIMWVMRIKPPLSHSFEIVIDNEKMMKSWEESGFPLKWNTLGEK